jgi:hypothetical protein
MGANAPPEDHVKLDRQPGRRSDAFALEKKMTAEFVAAS